ncbi:MAG: hypothetical protein O9325_23125 [Roseomonas sp.]|nr:hypothetical protein [Roseomonas sp.]
MDEKDRVFARFNDDEQAASKGRELVTSPRRAESAGDQVVEVVHARSGNSTEEKPPGCC